MNIRYYIMQDGQTEQEVTLEEYVKCERAAGFRPKVGFPSGAAATSSFNGRGWHGRTTYEGKDVKLEYDAGEVDNLLKDLNFVSTFRRTYFGEKFTYQDPLKQEVEPVDGPKESERWFVKVPGFVALKLCVVTYITDKVVTLQYYANGSVTETHERSAVKFIEKHKNELS